jgi:hypothetical protein
MPWDEECMMAQPASVFVCGGSGCSKPEEASCSPTYLPCEGKTCGELCSVCDTESDPDCFASQLLFCNGDGPMAACSETAFCPVLDCGSLPCGAQCQACAANDSSCTPMFCNDVGECTFADFVQCGFYPACDTKTCGEPCTLCDVTMMSCDQATFLVCGADGGPCTDQPSCAYAPCAGKTCGIPCTICPPGDMTCMEPDPGTPKACDAGGQCTPAPVGCSG